MIRVRLSSGFATTSVSAELYEKSRWKSIAIGEIITYCTSISIIERAIHALCPNKRPHLYA